jgi:hypothetical protein
MKRLALLIALLGIVAGCGSKSSPPLQVSGVPSSQDCDAKGISSSAGKAGTCDVSGTKVTVTARGGPLRMKGYTVQVVGIRMSSQLGNRAAANFTPSGQFVIATLRVTNTGTKRQRFDSTAKFAYLLVDGTEYAEVPAAEGQLRSSFHRAGSSIKPGQSATASIVFDPPADHAKNVGGDKSYVVFLNAQDAGNGYPRVGFSALGFIQLAK